MVGKLGGAEEGLRLPIEADSQSVVLWVTDTSTGVPVDRGIPLVVQTADANDLLAWDRSTEDATSISDLAGLNVTVDFRVDGDHLRATGLESMGYDGPSQPDQPGSSSVVTETLSREQEREVARLAFSDPGSWVRMTSDGVGIVRGHPVSYGADRLFLASIETTCGLQTQVIIDLVI
ncbi:MAG: hypothetical protein U1E22_03725, partial [Coriobacteriia bacterium]|nr:hypothetical protein [Coriobacteriia bacterium]